LPRVRFGAFGARHGPEQVNRFFDLVALHKTGAQLLLGGAAVLLQTVTGIVILSFYHPLMLALSVLLIATMGFVVFGLGRGAPQTALAESSAKYALAEWFEELARHGAAFRSRSGRRYALERSDALATNWITARTTHYRLVLRQLVGALGLQVVVNTLVLALGGFLVVSGELTLGQLVASEIIVAAVVSAFARLGKQLESFYDLLASVDKLGILFDLPLERATGRSKPDLAGPAGLEAFDVGYGFEGRSVLSHVDMHLEAGERVALKGPAGSGKTTLVDLLCALRDPQTGRVEIDGEDTREICLETLRERIVCIREAEVFSGSIRENLRVARSDASDGEIDDVLRAIGLLDELRALPDGLATRVSTDGLPMTRSQVARLMFARALLSRPSILMVDGELAMVEGPERIELLDALFDPERPLTLLVVSSCDDVVARCDRSVFLTAAGAPRVEASDDEAVRAESVDV
jgi:ABC-type bacteriocin/lantibiotic exporter with double-glycine peptidase domain